MKPNLPLTLFILVELVVISLILATAGSLPAHIASHFDGAGTPNGFMTKAVYTPFMLVFAAGIPAFIVILMHGLLYLAPDSINVPNREYWLSPERKSATVQFLKGHSTYIGMLTALFVAYVHWLLIRANSLYPPRLSTTLLLSGMGVFVGGLLLWVAWLFIRFKRVPSRYTDR